MHIGFYGEPFWNVSYLECSRFHSLLVMRRSCNLESYDTREELLPYLAPHQATVDEMEPVSAATPCALWIRHLRTSEKLISDIEAYHTKWYSKPAEHIHCYRRGKLLFWFHDAFTGGEMQISTSITQEQVARFCHDVGPRYTLAPPQ